MCGIAGILGSLNGSNRAALQRMTDALAHRGPDGGGIWESSQAPDGFGCMLGHRRLSIIDLSSAADQPMTDDTGGHNRAIVFNGEIYNFKDLRRDLEQSGEAFQSSGDTAVLLRLLALRGTDAVVMLRGMFAFALWDDHSRRLLLARDPLGIKPLYVCQNPDPRGEWSLMFSSEVRSILAAGLLEHPRLDRRAVRSILWNGFVVGPITAVAGCGAARCRRMAHDRSLRHDAPRATYWSIPHHEDRPSIDEAELRQVVEDSVARHLIADVPVGIFLSGGIDSSAVAALAQRADATPVHTFTLSFDEQEFNEGEVAQAIAHAIGSEHHEIRLTEADFTSALDTAVETLDQPDVRRLELVLHLQGSSRRRPQGGAGWHGGRRAVRRVPHLPRGADPAGMEPSHAGDSLILADARRPTREPDARRLRWNHGAADAVGQVPGDGSGRRGSHGLVPAGLRVVSTGLSGAPAVGCAEQSTACATA